MFLLSNVVRPHILYLTPYSSARDEYSGKEGIFLDANENPYGSVISGNYNRYPDPYQWEIKQKIAEMKGISPQQIFLGNGSDEPIDLLIKATCEPLKDNIIIMPPTYGMYKVCADIQNVEIKQVPLKPNFQIDTEAVLEAVDANTKLIWVCSPNNPSGNLLAKDSILELINHFKTGLVVVDEAYIDFAKAESFISELNTHENLVVLQTFSKAWGLAALRLGMAFGSAELIKILNKIKYPYNINLVTQQLLLKAVGQEQKKNNFVEKILKQRFHLWKELIELPNVEHVYPSDSNMLLVKFEDAPKVFQALIEQKIITRDRSNVKLCDNCIRITVGTAKENKILLDALAEISRN